jgi:RHS repeat-associated protein
VEWYKPDVQSYADYYVFGAPQTGRAGGSYRYGFNGMEQDAEMKGERLSYTTEFRSYDPRVGRWMSVDPIVKDWESGYAAFANNPVLFIDPSGLNPSTGDDPPCPTSPDGALRNIPTGTPSGNWVSTSEGYVNSTHVSCGGLTDAGGQVYFMPDGGKFDGTNAKGKYWIDLDGPKGTLIDPAPITGGSEDGSSSVELPKKEVLIPEKKPDPCFEPVSNNIPAPDQNIDVAPKTTPKQFNIQFDDGTATFANPGSTKGILGGMVAAFPGTSSTSSKPVTVVNKSGNCTTTVTTWFTDEITNTYSIEFHTNYKDTPKHQTLLTQRYIEIKKLVQSPNNPLGPPAFKVTNGGFHWEAPLAKGSSTGNVTVINITTTTKRIMHTTITEECYKKVPCK